MDRCQSRRSSHDSPNEVYEINGILAVVDAEQLPRLEGEMAQLARHQLRVADLVVLNKTDLVSSDLLAQVRQLVQLLTPGSRIIDAVHGIITIKDLEGRYQLVNPAASQASLIRYGSSNIETV